MSRKQGASSSIKEMIGIIINLTSHNLVMEIVQKKIIHNLYVFHIDIVH
jgi:hypothetical protein